MNMKNVIVSGLVVASIQSVAMPSKTDLDKVSPVVQDLMRSEQDALKAGTKTRSEVAGAALELVEQADGEAATLLLVKGAFNLYVRDGQFDKALDTLKVMRTKVPDITPQYLSDVIETALRRAPKKNGGQLHQILNETKTFARYQDELKKLAAQAKKRPADKALQVKLAEHYAVLGDWPKALEHFTKGEDAKAAQMAKNEKDGAKGAKAIGDFWWAYPDKKGDEFEKSFKQHAAALYEDAIADGEISGLGKVQIERRIEAAKEYGENVFNIVKDKGGLYCVIDLSCGPDARKYPVSYLDAIPKDGWSDEYKTSKLVLRRIAPGKGRISFRSNRFGHVDAAFTITKPYYIGVFEVTQRQWELVVGNNPSVFTNKLWYATRPVDNINWGVVRGKANWPTSSYVSENSFVGRLRKKTKLLVDLPTEVQWEFAARAGSGVGPVSPERTKGWNPQWGKCDDRNVGNLAKTIVDRNSSTDFGTAKVGSYDPNEWGLYDVVGNVCEMCLDWGGCIEDNTVDYQGATNGPFRVARGGCWCWIGNAIGQHSDNYGPTRMQQYYGFRLAIQPPFTSTNLGIVNERQMRAIH